MKHFDNFDFWKLIIFVIKKFSAIENLSLTKYCLQKKTLKLLSSFNNEKERRVDQKKIDSKLICLIKKRKRVDQVNSISGQKMIRTAN